MKVPSTITTLLVGIGLTLACLWIGQNHGLLPTDASEEAARIDTLFGAMLAISAGLFFLVQGAIVYSVFRFRRRPGDETDAAPIEGNVPLEILWTAVPTVIVLWLAIYSFDVYKTVNGGAAIGDAHMAHGHAVEQVAALPGSAIAAPVPDTTPSNSMSGTEMSAETAVPESDITDPVTINVNGLQYAWIFTYPDSGIISGEMHVPQGRLVKLNISASDVIHAFWVPEFRLKQDAIPGQETHLNFTPSRLGNYPLICAELCGAYHGGMKTRVIVQTPEEYQDWIDSQRVAAAESVTVAELPSAVESLGITTDAAELSHLHHHMMDQPEMTEMAQMMS